MFAILLLAASSLVAADAAPSTCLAGKRQALIDGGFTGPLVCSKNLATFRLIGRPSGSGYAVYDYRYCFLPHAGGVMHGGQRLIVFQGNAYVGNYMLQPEVSVAVRGAQVVLKGHDDRETVRLDFSRKPPSRILVNGEVDIFDR